MSGHWNYIRTVRNIDFTAVGATGLLPLDISEAVIKEKLSLMLYARYISTPAGEDYDYMRYSEFVHPGHDEPYAPKFSVKKGSTVYSAFLAKDPPRLFFSKMGTETDGNLNSLAWIPIKTDASPEEISVFDYTRKKSVPSDPDRINDLLNFFKTGNHPYSTFKLSTTFHLQLFPTTLPTERDDNPAVFVDYQRALKKWYNSGFPRRYDLCDPEKVRPNNTILTPFASGINRDNVTLPPPVFYNPLGPMDYSLVDGYPEMRLHRLFLNPEACGLREALIPSILIHLDGCSNDVMTGFPNKTQLPLWGSEQVLSPDTETVVLCACIQDAEALQRKNKSLDAVAFTSFVDVGEKLELIDFTPLIKKKIIFLVSNHNGGTLADAYEEIARVFEYIKKSGVKIKNCVFVQREVQYPGSTLTIATPEELVREYNRTSPQIVPESMIPPMDVTEFFTMLAKIRKEREAPPFWAPEEQTVPVKKNPAEGILIRSLLYRNAITVLAGPPAAGKSRFCRSLIRYLVKGNDRKYMKERFWTRCCAESPMKILYWNFDCIPDLETSWKKICLRGLSEEQKENIFIENAPTEEEFFDKYYEKPDVEAYRNKLATYTYSKGTPGHPLDLLIVDTLVSVWNKKNIEVSLRFLSLLMKAMPGMAVLAIHHTTELGKPLGGGDPKRMPRIVLTMERINRTVDLGSSSEQSAKKQKGKKKKTVSTDLYRFRYDKFSMSHADVEDLPFYCVREDEDMYSVYKPVCTRDEMFRSLVYHYREKDDAQPSNKVIGAMLRYCEHAVQLRAIDEKEYFEILKKAQEKVKEEI